MKFAATVVAVTVASASAFIPGATFVRVSNKFQVVL
jgi:hypothetical protein